MARKESTKLIFFISCILALALAVSRVPGAQGQPQKGKANPDAPGVNPDALIVQDFENRIFEYVKLHKTIEAKLPALKPTASPEKIVHHQHELAEKIHEARHGVSQGNIFTPEISTEFRRLMAITMHDGQAAAHVHTSLKHAEPVRVPIRVNGAYPDRVPLQSTPPTLLLNLPKLPAEVEYRIVGNSLVLRDVNSNLIIDFMSGAIP